MQRDAHKRFRVGRFLTLEGDGGETEDQDRNRKYEGVARVNVYLCIKQALFIRPMNMHCLVPVARCRVQTRRYHCLINHTQSRWQPLPIRAVLQSCRGHGLVPLSEW